MWNGEVGVLGVEVGFFRLARRDPREDLRAGLDIRRPVQSLDRGALSINLYVELKLSLGPISSGPA